MAQRDLATNDDPVPERVMELAAGKRLGWLRAQYQPQQRRVFTRWNEWRRVPSVVRGAPFVHEGVWGPEIQKGVTRMRLPEVLGRIGRGETLDFNRFTVTAESVSVQNKSLPWAEVTGVDVSNGLVSISRGRRTLPPVLANEVPNLQLALVLMELLRKESSPPPRGGPSARPGEGR